MMVQGCHGADEAGDGVFGGVVERGEKGGDLPGYRGDVDDVVCRCRWLTGGRRCGGRRRGRAATGEEVGNSELGCADWVGKVDVEEGVARGVTRVARGGGAGWVPEGGERLMRQVRCQRGKRIGKGRQGLRKGDGHHTGS